MEFNSIATCNNLRVSFYTDQFCILLHSTCKSDSLVEIMLKQVTLEKAIDIVRLTIALSFCWPLPPHSSRTKLLLYKTTQLFAAISIIFLVLPLIYAIYIRSDDIEIISLCLSQVILMMQGVIQTVICSNKHDTLQVSS